MKNGIEAMRDAGVDPKAITVTAHFASYGAMAHVAARYIRHGLDERMLERIFDPFFSTRSSRLSMGAPISRAIIEDHGGRLRVEPVEGKRASVHFTRPTTS